MDSAHVHAVLRFAFAVTLAFVVAELMEWTPPFLSPVLTCVVMANIPMRPPLKVAIGFSLVIGASAFFALTLSYALRGVPYILFGLSTLIVFHSLYALAKGASKLGPLFIIICVTAIPVVGMQSLAAAQHFAEAFAAGACFAIFMAWVSWLLFPKPAPLRAAPEATALSPDIALRSALLGTAILAPLMLAYLMLGLHTALPVMIGTVMIVATLDFHLGRKQAALRVIANFCGGVSSVVVLILLAIHPTFATFVLLVLASALLFGLRISHGDPMAQLLTVACNGYLIVFGTALHSDSGTFDVWLTRVGYFFLAGVFTIGMMALIWPPTLKPDPTPAQTGDGP
ncbi:MAG TPA: DUF2955 domain-containing protein [Steroidobacteraceae bacterium]